MMVSQIVTMAVMKRAALPWRHINVNLINNSNADLLASVFPKLGIVMVSVFNRLKKEKVLNSIVYFFVGIRGYQHFSGLNFKKIPASIG